MEMSSIYKFISAAMSANVRCRSRLLLRRFYQMVRTV
jgi:hypothetical protein